jgi:hypothetical protein
MLDAIPSDALSEWLAFELIHVSDARRAGAQVSATLANLWDQSGRRWAEADFLPGPLAPPEEQSPEDMKSAMRGLAAGKG